MYEIDCTIREQHGEYYYKLEAWSSAPTEKYRVISSVSHLPVPPNDRGTEPLEILTVLSLICTKLAQMQELELF